MDRRGKARTLIRVQRDRQKVIAALLVTIRRGTKLTRPDAILLDCVDRFVREKARRFRYGPA